LIQAASSRWEHYVALCSVLILLYMCPHTQRVLEESILPTYLRRSKSELRNWVWWENCWQTGKSRLKFMVSRWREPLYGCMKMLKHLNMNVSSVFTNHPLFTNHLRFH
jgi:hypothetical protein